jgi:uncharacterized cofD-like protein
VTESSSTASLRVAVLGGGNGIFAILRGLSSIARSGSIHVSAVIATADDGGSSGRLRRARGGLPPGDLRNALLAMSPETSPLASLFAHRFDGSGEVGGHSLGNLILHALSERHGCYLSGLEEAGRLLGCAGRVFPATREPVVLRAETQSGTRLDGESRVGSCADGIARVWLEPSAPDAYPEAAEAVREADLVVIGPGSLFTSLLPVLLVPALGSAVRDKPGRRVLVANLMTQKGETVGMTLDDHLETMEAHLGPGMIDDVVVHRGGIELERLAPYRDEGAARVAPMLRNRRSERLLAGNLLCPAGKIRHDPARTASVLVRLARSISQHSAASKRPRMVERP